MLACCVSGWTAPPHARMRPLCMQLAAEQHAWGPITVPEPLFERLRSAGYYRPMPIQAEAMALIAEGTNVILHAATGSGKTVAFLAPLLASLDHEAGLQVVVVCPSQELAVQIATEARLLHREDAGLLALSTSDEAQQEQELSLQRTLAPIQIAIGSALPAAAPAPPPRPARPLCRGFTPCPAPHRGRTCSPALLQRLTRRAPCGAQRRSGCSICSAGAALARGASSCARWCWTRSTRCCPPRTPAAPPPGAIPARGAAGAGARRAAAARGAAAARAAAAAAARGAAAARHS